MVVISKKYEQHLNGTWSDASEGIITIDWNTGENLYMAKINTMNEMCDMHLDNHRHMTEDVLYALDMLEPEN